MAFDRQAAIDAGYSDEEINAFLQSKPELAREEKKIQTTGEPPAPSTTINEVGTSPAAVATTAALAAAPYVVPAAGAAAAAVGGNKLYGAWKQSAQAAQALADAKMASEQGIAQRAAQKMAGPVAPSSPASSPILDSAGRPMAPSAPSGPVAPQAAQSPIQAAAQRAPQAGSSVIDRASQIVRNMALDKLLKGGAMAGLATYSGGLNTNEDQELARRRSTELEQARRLGYIK